MRSAAPSLLRLLSIMAFISTRSAAPRLFKPLNTMAFTSTKSELPSLFLIKWIFPGHHQAPTVRGRFRFIEFFFFDGTKFFQRLAVKMGPIDTVGLLSWDERGARF